MKKILEKYKKQILLMFLIVFLGILYFSYNITTTWDTSEYLGLADYIGTKDMAENWIGHRGIGFPLLLKLFKPFGIENKIFMLILMFIFYIGMVIILYKIYEKLKEHEVLNNKISKWIFGIYATIFIVLNPMIFGYYHTLLTEFVSMTITLLMCYLSWKWIDYTWEENKKEIIIYGVLFSIFTIILYHVKQSLIPLSLLPILTASIVSIFNNFKLSNLLTKSITILSVLIMLFCSISIWNNSMKTANVAEATGEARVNGFLITGLTQLKQICNEKTIDESAFDRNLISDKDNKKIDEILAKESKYKKFRIYETCNEKYLVYYTKGNYSNKEDVGFYLKILFNSPETIAKSYYDSYWKIVFSRKELPIWIGKENYVIPYRIYQDRENVVDVNENYEQYIENYRSVNETNFVSNVFNMYADGTLKIISTFTKMSLWILPMVWLISVVVYICINRKLSKNNLKIFQLLVVLNTTAFGSIMSYVIFAANVDRYVVPSLIPIFIANFLGIVLLTKIDISKEKK